MTQRNNEWWTKYAELDLNILQHAHVLKYYIVSHYYVLLCLGLIWSLKYKTKIKFDKSSKYKY